MNMSLIYLLFWWSMVLAFKTCSSQEQVCWVCLKTAFTKIRSGFLRSGRIWWLALPKLVDHEGFVERLVLDAEVQTDALMTPTQL